MNKNNLQNESNLMEQFFRAMMLLHRYHHHNRKEHGHFGDPLRGQGRVLSILKMKPEITQKELGYLLDVRNQSLGELLTKLEKAGFITRTQSEIDRRVMDIKLTEAGAKAADKTEEEQQDFDKLFDCLNDEEQKNLNEYLNRLIGELESQMGNDDRSGMPPIPHDMRGEFGLGRGRGRFSFDMNKYDDQRGSFFGRYSNKDEDEK